MSHRIKAKRKGQPDIVILESPPDRLCERDAPDAAHQQTRASHQGVMTIAEALRAVNDDYNEECRRMREDKAFGAMCAECIRSEYDELDQELPDFVGDIAIGLGAPPGTFLPPPIYQMARMCFRLGMRTQRKLDRPQEPTSMFWRSDKKAV